MENKFSKVLLRTVSYILVAALASMATLFLYIPRREQTKLEELQTLLTDKYIGEADPQKLQDGAAEGMIAGLGDRWSYYISAEDYVAHTEQKENHYVGIGITIQERTDGIGFDIVTVEPDGPAMEAGVLPGDVLTHVNGQEAAPLGTTGTRNVVRGEAGTAVDISILRDGETLELTIPRQEIQVVVAYGELLEGGIGLITISNFNEKCADETIQAIEDLQAQGAEKLIFDVRFNPGGYKSELVELLDYLLPEGPLFRSVNYKGEEAVDTSDADCLKLPMAVLINGDSYSAAEFFAAALEEYDWAVTVGEPTVGKSYYQNTVRLSDGSAVALSMGKYETPNGVTLAEVGGLVPNITVKVDWETAAKIYGNLLPHEEDTQLQAAIAALE